MQIVAEGLACVRGGREGFRNLHFAVDRGEMLAITGPNGAGKSSLLRVVAGLVRPSEGRLILHGGDAELSIGEQAHYVGHQDAFKPSLTVQENLVFWSDFLGGGEVATSLACVGLYALAHLPARYLSAGQRRRRSPPPPPAVGGSPWGPRAARAPRLPRQVGAGLRTSWGPMSAKGKSPWQPPTAPCRKPRRN